MRQGKGEIIGHCRYCGLPFWSRYGLSQHEKRHCKSPDIEAPEPDPEPPKHYKPRAVMGGAIIWSKD